MSILVVQIPPRQRLRPAHAGGSQASASEASTEYLYATSPDGLALESQGQCVASLLPKAAAVIAVVCEADVSWHRIVLPKAPAARMRAALSGVLEEALLDDPGEVHLALAPQASAGHSTWVAALAHRWLKAEVAALEKADVFIDRVVPMTWPDDPPTGHFAEIQNAEGASTAGVALNWANTQGVVSVRLQGELARALVPLPAPAGTRWSATPGAATVAERWLGGMPVNVMTHSHRMLQAARSLWNIRQFDLAKRTRSARALRDSWRKLFSPEWRPVRWGVLALLVAQVVGLNFWAWHLQNSMATQRRAIQQTVKAAHPKVADTDIQRDAAAVMQREIQALRTLAGKPGEADLEALLHAASAAWPADLAPADNLRFEPGKLSLSASGWNAPQIEQFRTQLGPRAWRLESAEGRLSLTRARSGSLP
jgi:general secretion pathway protein L